MRTDEFDYELPEELIAQTPVERGASRLLVLHRDTGRIEHRRFGDLPEYLAPEDVLVLNDTRVSARRIHAQRENGQDAEVLLLGPSGERSCIALVWPGRAFRIGRTVTLTGPAGDKAAAVVTSLAADGGRLLAFTTAEDRDRVMTWGSTPLPPYIRASLPVDQEERYQTVYGTHAGSAAAPTAGLHFDSEMLSRLAAKGVIAAYVTLHVGVDTFRPVRTEIAEDHEMHGEVAELRPQNAAAINGARGRVVAVGTTSVRTLESASKLAAKAGTSPNRVEPFAGETRLFITPGHRFRAVDALLTNFHLPKSTLLMLVSAFAGVELVRHAYRTAIEERYRFFSFGDAMLIL